jgi:hypothetical protein
VSPLRRGALAVLTLGLAGCTITMKQVDVDASRLVISSAKRLDCPRSLVEVVDVRPEQDGSGIVGANVYRFEDAAAVVRRTLLDAGFADAGETADGVRVRIMRLYMAQKVAQLYMGQQSVTNVPVAVYEVKVGDAQPFVIRSQPANMDWHSSETEAYAGYSLAIEGANHQLIDRLNAGCRR